jgi:hypothetical protein
MDDPNADVRSAAGDAVKRIKKTDSLDKEIEDLGSWLDEKLRNLDSTIQGES